MTDAPTLADEERDAFLGAGGTGVLAFATDDGEPPHAVPVSYGYDASAGSFYFRLAVDPSRDKQAYLDRPVSFVVHGETDDGYRSVIAVGRLVATDDERVAIESLPELARVHVPLVEMFDYPTSDVEFDFFRLAPNRLTTRGEREAVGV